MLSAEKIGLDFCIKHICRQRRCAQFSRQTVPTRWRLTNWNHSTSDGFVFLVPRADNRPQLTPAVDRDIGDAYVIRQTDTTALLYMKRMNEYFICRHQRRVMPAKYLSLRIGLREWFNDDIIVFCDL